MTDYEAVVAYQNGDQEAYSFLFNKYKNAVQGYCWKIVNNEQDAEDITQNVWLYLHSYLHEFKQECSFVTMMYKIAKDRTLDFIRDNENSETPIPFEEMQELLVVSEHSPETDLLVNDLLKTLDLYDRILIQLKIEGYTDEELAEKYDRPLNTMKSDIFRIREKLRESVPERGKI